MVFYMRKDIPLPFHANPKDSFGLALGKESLGSEHYLSST